MSRPSRLWLTVDTDMHAVAKPGKDVVHHLLPQRRYLNWGEVKVPRPTVASTILASWHLAKADWGWYGWLRLILSNPKIMQTPQQSEKANHNTMETPAPQRFDQDSYCPTTSPVRKSHYRHPKPLIGARQCWRLIWLPGWIWDPWNCLLGPPATNARILRSRPWCRGSLWA